MYAEEIVPHIAVTAARAVGIACRASSTDSVGVNCKALTQITKALMNHRIEPEPSSTARGGSSVVSQAWTVDASTVSFNEHGRCAVPA